MNSLKQLVVVTIFAALACAGLNAQNLDIRANIPFEFQAGDKLMPAGEYSVHEQGVFVILRTLDGGKQAVALMTNGARGTDPSRAARLDFNRYGDAYFLTTIWSPFSVEGRQIPQTSREKELAKRLGVPAKPVVLASNKQ